MKTQHLHDTWESPDNSRLTSKQFSFRFPVHIAAKIAALCEMYPQKNRTNIVADLLAAALDDLEKSLPASLIEQTEEENRNDAEIAHQTGYEYEQYYEIGGQRGRFRYLANKHYSELEQELGNENPIPLFDNLYTTEKQFKESQSK
jgi:hypothetical protein